MKAVVVGGTGTLGQELVRRLLEDPENEITVLSRCELKQKQMRESLSSSARVRFVLGDIRDPNSLSRAFRGADAVFHVAALKHVDTLELNPEESIETNVLGTINVADVAEACGVGYVVFSSTDKAVDPINAYGMSKALAEKVLLRRNEIQEDTRYSVFRWGNVLNSRGSFLPSIVDCIRTGRPVPLTHPSMTRFWIRIEDAVNFMLLNYRDASLDKAMIPPIKGAPLLLVVWAIAEILGVEYPSGYDVHYVGLRPGEKLHESLISQWELGPNQVMDSTRGPQLSYAELKELLAQSLGLTEVKSA